MRRPARVALVAFAGLVVGCQGEPRESSGETGGLTPAMRSDGAPAAQGAGAQQSQRIEFLGPDSSLYPFSPAVRAGGFLFLSGQIGTRTENGRMVLVPGGVEPETRQTMDNIRDILVANGSSLERVVKCTVMIADMADWPRINTVYAEYFPGRKPARSALGANGLALGARVEIECIAAV